VVVSVAVKALQSQHKQIEGLPNVLFVTGMDRAQPNRTP
jgi:hypothetical protein